LKVLLSFFLPSDTVASKMEIEVRKLPFLLTPTALLWPTVPLEALATRLRHWLSLQSLKSLAFVHIRRDSQFCRFTSPPELFAPRFHS